ncbi:ProQ/FINO family protein [Tranquillimonas alkanivorans]|uniref:ProQ/FINO family protein n=1 Tax=Tranquillimonas alkanivorans TaxID=441119 RepID=A0A1I5WES5_9RHOB|nr:ProQ/FINO family protein [Tranquillimonas alkanivorans]SFQ18225.1 ProQ/FINO family protein [Tranquillimonas alkanivorans]
MDTQKKTLGEKVFGGFDWPDGRIPPIIAGQPIPMETGMDKQLRPLLPETQHAAFDKQMGMWAHGWPYLKSVEAEGSMRHNINASPVQEVSEAHRDDARRRLAQRSLQKAHQRKKDVDRHLDAIDAMFAAPSKESLTAAREALQKVRELLS